MAARMDIVVGPIERLALDAVVNAANRMLAPGSGVDGALRAAAGPELTRHTDTMAQIDVGEAVITPGFKLAARHIVHTAAPIWAAPGEDGVKIAGLARCYANAIALAGASGAASIAFPCLGTGNFGWPRELACDIALSTCMEALSITPSITRIVFCCFSEADAAPYRARLG